MGPKELKVACPTCGKPVVRRRPQDAPFFPFCSDRCRLLDLGKWLDGKHRISEDLPEGTGESKEKDEGGEEDEISG